MSVQTEPSSTPSVASVPPPKRHFPKGSPYYDHGVISKNQICLHYLYVQILKDFQRQLSERIAEGARPLPNEEAVERFASAVKYFYNHPMGSYAKAVRTRQTGKPASAKHEEKLEEAQKYEYFEEVEEDEEGEEGDCEVRGVKPQAAFQMSDGFAYRPLNPIVGFSTPKLEERLRPTVDLKEESLQTSSNSDSSSSYSCAWEAGYGQAAERLTNCLMLGVFVTNKIKRKPKEERILVELHSVIAKFAHNGRDAYFERANLDLRKIEKAEAPFT